MSIRVLIADDHTILREGVRALLEKTQDMTVVAEAGDGPSAIALAQEHKPDVVLMDVSMPGMNGIEATRQVLAAVPNARVIALTMNSDQQVLENMLHAGASGFLLKDCATKELTGAIRDVVAGRSYISAEIMPLVIEDYFKRVREARTDTAAALTPSERTVLKLLADGLSSKEMAAQLNLSTKTVEMHRMHIMQKLQLHSVAELTKYAISAGISSI